MNRFKVKPSLKSGPKVIKPKPKPKTRYQSTKEALNALKGKPTVDSTQYETKTVSKSVYYLCRFNTSCQFKSEPNSLASIEQHIRRHHKKQTFVGQTERKSCAETEAKQLNGKECKCDEKGCEKSFKLRYQLLSHKRHHKCGFRIRSLADNEICSQMNINKWIEKKCNPRTEYRCQWHGCGLKHIKVSNVRIHVHDCHLCPNRRRTEANESESQSIGSTVETNRVRNESQTDGENRSKALNRRQKTSQTFGNKCISAENCRQNKETNESLISDDSSDTDCATDGQTDENKVKNSSKLFRCDANECELRFKTIFDLKRHEKTHKNSAEEDSMAEKDSEDRQTGDDMRDRSLKQMMTTIIQSELKKYFNNKKSEESDDANEVEFIGVVKREDVFEDVDQMNSKTTSEKSTSSQTQTIPTEDQIPTQVSTNGTNTEPIDTEMDFNANQSNAVPDRSDRNWSELIPNITSFKQSAFKELKINMECVCDLSEELEPIDWPMISQRMRGNEYEGFDVEACMQMFNEYVYGHYAQTLIHSPDLKSANEAFPLFHTIHDMDLSRSLPYQSFTKINALKQEFAERCLKS